MTTEITHPTRAPETPSRLPATALDPPDRGAYALALLLACLWSAAGGFIAALVLL